MEFRKIKGKVLLVEEPVKSDIVSSGGILLPDSDSGDMIENWYCVVVGIGDGCSDDYNIGDIVIIDPSLPYVGYRDPDSKRSRMFIPQDRILAIK